MTRESPRLQPRDELPHLSHCPAEFWAGWWNGMALGAVLSAAILTIVWKVAQS